MRTYLSQLLAAVGLCLVTTGAVLSADVLIFTNGDRLTGTFERQEDGVLYFYSDIVGEMAISAEVARVVIDEQDGEERERRQAEAESAETEEAVDFVGGRDPDAPSEVTEPAPPEPDVPALPDEDVVVVTPENVTESEPGDDVVTILELDPLMAAERKVLEFFSGIAPDFVLRFVDRWRSRIDFGLTFEESERDRTDFSLRAETERKWESQSLRLTGRYDYSERDSAEGVPRRVTDRYSASARWRWDLASWLFFQANSNFLRDQVREVDNQFQQSAGLGWRYLDGDRFRGTLTPSISARFQQVAFEEGTWEPLGTVFQDFRFIITERLSFTEEAEFSINPDNPEEFTYEINNRLEAKLTAYLNATLRYELEFDNTLPEDIEKLTRRLVVGLGVAF